MTTLINLIKMLIRVGRVCSDYIFSTVNMNKLNVWFIAYSCWVKTNWCRIFHLFIFFGRKVYLICLLCLFQFFSALCSRSSPSSLSALCFYTRTQVGSYTLKISFTSRTTTDMTTQVAKNSLQACDWQRKGKFSESKDCPYFCLFLR